MNASSTLVKPAHLSVPDYHHTYGAEVADLGRAIGYGPDPEQELILDGRFAVDRFGKLAAFEVVIICARQNLKTGTEKLAALGDLFLMDQRLVVFSAHEFRTVAEAFRDLELLIDGSDMLRRRVKQIHRGNGDEAIELVDDRRLIFRTRTKGGGRGLSGDKVFLDEAMFLQGIQMGALVPTLSSRPDPQLTYGSSAALASSEVLHPLIARGRSGKEPRLAYYEWCAPDPSEVCAQGDACMHALDIEGCGCDKPELWRNANPALDRRITLQYIADERRSGMPPAEFARERMGWHDEPASGRTPITPELWATRVDTESVALDPVALAVDIAPDRSSSAIAIAGRRLDGLTHGELIEHRAGTGWVLTRLAEIAAKNQVCVLVINPAGAAGSLEKPLIEAGWEIQTDPDKPVTKRLHLTSTREYAQSCGALVDDVVNNGIRYRPAMSLDQAVKGVRTRPLADAYAWSHQHSTADITPLAALTLARHGHATYGVTTPPEPFFVRGA